MTIQFLRRIKNNMVAFGIMPSIFVATQTLRNLVYFSKGSSDKNIALVTFSINPDLARVWSFFAASSVGDICDIYIVDSSGSLFQNEVEGAKVIYFWNIEHGAKMDYFSRHLKYDYIFFNDDDAILPNGKGPAWGIEQLKSDNTWAASLLPRAQKLKFNQFEQRAMGSYSFMFQRSIYLKESFSFRTRECKDAKINWGRGYFDTCDFAHYQSLVRGYRVAILTNNEDVILPFMGTSIVYLKMRKGINSIEKFVEHVNLHPNDWRRASGLLGSAFCLSKIYELYSIIFETEPKWRPPIKDTDIRDIASDLRNTKAKARAYSYFDRYQANYVKLASTVPNMTSPS